MSTDSVLQSLARVSVGWLVGWFSFINENIYEKETGGYESFGAQSCTFPL